eukprot:g594.t1
MMGKPVLRLLGLLCAAWLAACAPVAPPPSADAGPAIREIHVVSNGWHTGIVLARTDSAALGALPEIEDLPDAVYLEFGWGDRVYYPAGEKTLGMTLSAALTPTPSVMHMAGRSRPPRGGDERWEAVALMLTQGGFDALVRAISDGFKRPDGDRAQPVAPGLTSSSYFYDAHGDFHLFNTCNTWTARMLRAAGIGVSPSGVITAEDLMTRLREAMQRRPRS